MEKMFFVTAFVAASFTLFQGSSECDKLVVLEAQDVELFGTTERFSEFEAAVQKAADDMGVPKDVQISVMVASCKYAGDAWTYKLFDGIKALNMPKTYGVYIAGLTTKQFQPSGICSGS